MAVSLVVGIITVIGAVVFFGSFAVPTKTKRVVEANIDPTVFQCYFSVAIFLSSFLVLTYNKFYFTPLGLIGASLWVPASMLSLVAIKLVGISVAQPIWSGGTVIMSFLWGALAFGDPLSSVALSLLGIGILIVGIVGVSLVQRTSPVQEGPSEALPEYVPEAHVYTGSVNSTPGDIESAPVPDAQDLEEPDKAMLDHEKKGPPLALKRLVGILCALGVAVLNGSMMVPLRFVPKEHRGIGYIVSFGIGTLCVTPLLTLVLAIVRRKPIVLHFRAAVLPAAATGLCWNIGNFCSIYATLSPLGMTAGFPLTQVALLVSALWGALYYKEVKSKKRLLLLLLSSLVILGGAALLAIFGHKKKH